MHSENVSFPIVGGAEVDVANWFFSFDDAILIAVRNRFR